MEKNLFVLSNTEMWWYVWLPLIGGFLSILGLFLRAYFAPKTDYSKSKLTKYKFFPLLKGKAISETDRKLVPSEIKEYSGWATEKNPLPEDQFKGNIFLKNYIPSGIIPWECYRKRIGVKNQPKLIN